MNRTTQEETYLAALAGLLHDVGKFALRAGEGARLMWDDEAERDYRYKHALLSADVVTKFVPAAWRTPVQQGVARHHRPQDRASRIVALADRLSAGEREDDAGTAQEEGERRSHPAQMLSIFCSVTADEKQAPSSLYLPLTPLAMERSALFPQAAAQKDAIWQSYEEMWRGFAAEAARIAQVHGQNGDLATFLESLLLLSQRYQWCVPSAYFRARPDVSLHDHGRMTAALAAILSSRSDDEIAAMLADPHAGDQPVALLVGADISGVQEFIYTISSRGAAAGLRGRSFYLQALTEAIARFVLARLELPIVNLVYAGGGNFYLLARPDDRARLVDAQRAISRALLQHHRGELFVALEAIPLATADFYDGQISAAWGGLAERLRQAKLRRFGELEKEELAALFNPQGHGGNEEQQCQVCSAEHETIIEDADDEGNVVRKCPSCKSYETLGDQLRRARYLWLEQVEPVAADPSAPAGRYGDALACFGLRVQAAEEHGNLPVSGGRRGLLLALDDADLDALTPSVTVSVGRRLLVNTTPILSAREYAGLRGKVKGLPRPESVKPFDVLQEQSRGIHRLGVLRMDVDNLGKLFSEGLGKSATLSRVASLSFSVSLFFEGWVGRLAEEGAGNLLYSVYSGGDDLFFVGAWDAVVELARRVRGDLTPYAANHPGIHASAGVALVGGKYPLSQAARDAGDAEAQAKAYRRAGGHDKDAICFLEMAQPWESFGLEESCAGGFGSIHQLAHLLAAMTAPEDRTRKAAPKSLIRDLLEQYAAYAEAMKGRRLAGADVSRGGAPQTPWGPWMWRTVYLLSRMAERMKGEKLTREEISALRDSLWKNDFGNIEWIGLAARWAELLTR